MHAQLLAVSALSGKLAQIANVLTHSYLVTYGHPDSLIPPEHTTVTAARRGERRRHGDVPRDDGSAWLAENGLQETPE